MRRKKRITIRLVALGLAVAALAAPPVQAGLDEGLNGLQPISIQTLTTADDIGRPSPGPTPHLVTADDVKHPSLVPNQPLAVKSDNGFEIWPVAMTIVLLLAVGAVVSAVHQARKGRLASA
jgi:hypothetical protein